jgi:hypothetical protein
MIKAALALLAIGLFGAAPAWPREHQRLRATYDVYAAGLDFASAEVLMGIGPASYQLDVRYRTTGVLGVLFPGRQQNIVVGAWDASRPMPHRYQGIGLWRGKEYVSQIDYNRQWPEVRTLLPALDEEREPVPPAMRDGSIDSLSALAGLMEQIGRDGRCDSSARLFDGRRASIVTARTLGEEPLDTSTRSSYAGRALRCDFEAMVTAGFRKSDSAEARARPFTGTAWFARPLPDAFPVPVRITFETRALGTARMYLTGIGRESAIRPVAAPMPPAGPGGEQSPPSP